MASIVKIKNKKTGTTYVYESESYWDKEKKQPRNKRRLIGKIDPETGEVVPTGKRGRKKKEPDPSEEQNRCDELSVKISSLEAVIKEKDLEIDLLKNQIKSLEKDKSLASERLKSILDILKP